MSTSIRDRAKRLSNTLFRAGDRLGVHVLPAHYYSSLPHWKWLSANEHAWRKPWDMHGVHWDLEAQAAWLRSSVESHASEVTIAQWRDAAEEVGGFRFGEIEAQALYGILRTRQPNRIVEVGSGSSTLVMSRAVDRNLREGGMGSQIVAIDPYTAGQVAGLPHVESSDVHGIALRLEDLDLSEGDVLFIDSTHAVRTGSELPNLYLDIIPNLPAGVLIHIHDIYLPYLFSPLLYDTYFDWQETTLVAALLVGNPNLVVRAGMAALSHERHQVLPELFSEYRPALVERGMFVGGVNGHLPCSLWLETTAS